MSRSQRDKGRRGERCAELLLLDRDYIDVQRLPCGREGPDIICYDDKGTRWVVEVKNRAVIAMRDFRKQCRSNAQKHRGKAMLLVKLPDTRSWLVERQGHRPVVWTEKG